MTAKEADVLVRFATKSSAKARRQYEYEAGYVTWEALITLHV